MIKNWVLAFIGVAALLLMGSILQEADDKTLSEIASHHPNLLTAKSTHQPLQWGI